MFLVDNEVQRLDGLRHALVVLLQVNLLGLQHTGLYSRFAEQLDEGLVLWKCLVAAEQ